VCSSGAGVYNEFLLKRPSSSSSSKAGVPVLIQNVCLYVDSLLCNIALLLWQGKGDVLLDMKALQVNPPN
jgi:UDP-sugar transporter A1/2/3